MKILCVLYDDPKTGMPERYARDDLPKLDKYPDGMTLPSPKAIDFTPGELLGCVSGELGLRKFLEDAGHTLVVTSELEAALVVIPEKATSFNIDCMNLGKMEEHFNTVDLLFSSPPYFILRKYQSNDSNQVGHEETKEDYCNRIANLIKSVIPTLKESANVIINIGETYDDGVGYGIPQLLKITIEKETGLIYKDQLIWSKPNPKPQNEWTSRPINNVEYLLWFVVDPKKAFYKLLTYMVMNNNGF